VGEPIRLQITAADVIHSFAVPSLWFKLDAFRAGSTKGADDRQARRLLRPVLRAVRRPHGYMPIAIEALPRDTVQRLGAWQSGGKIDGQKKPAARPPRRRPADAAAAAGCPCCERRRCRSCRSRC
jgi:cytochrome c oxidase subunit 2